MPTMVHLSRIACTIVGSAEDSQKAPLDPQRETKGVY